MKIRATLASKLTLFIAVVLVLGFGASTIWTIQREADLVLDQSKAAARRLADAIVASIESSMLQGRPDVTRTLLEELRGTGPVQGLVVYRTNGVEAFTDLTTLREVGQNTDLPREVRRNIERLRRPPASTADSPLFRRALRTLETQESVEMVDGVPLFTLHRPVPNRERCQGCHGTRDPVRAVVRVATSMAPVLAEVQRHRDRQVLIGLLTIVAAALVLTVTMRRVVVRPVTTMAAAARRVGAGDFTARVPAGTADELGALGRAFNEMTQRLSQAHADLERKNVELETALARLTESRRRVELLEQVKGQLAKFVPESVQRLLEANPGATELEKRMADVSVLFLDIAGYTKLAEELDPERLNQLVQVYFSSFLEIIQAHHGDINETAGDGLMVIFQANPGRGDHALDATRAALAIRQRALQLNGKWAGRFPPVELHMGLNTGEALVGATKLSSAGGHRWTFTASGPTTNLAARLADAAGPGQIVVGPTTAGRIRQHFVVETLGPHTLKNASTPIEVFQVIGAAVAARVG